VILPAEQLSACRARFRAGIPGLAETNWVVREVGSTSLEALAQIQKFHKFLDDSGAVDYTDIADY
jgi:hypothetical protein